MAVKVKNKKQQKQLALVTEKSWPDLPRQLVSIIGRHPTLKKYINFGGVIKTWRAAPKHCKPDSTLSWLQLFDPDAANSSKYRRHITRRGSINTSFSYVVWGCWCRSFFSKLPMYPWKDYVGCSNGILVAEGEPLYIYYLWNPIEREWYHLPFWDAKVPFKLAALSSSPADKSCTTCTVMVLTGITHPAFAFYKLTRSSKMGEKPEWAKRDCALTEPNSLGQSGRQQIMQFTNAIGFKGKFYALSLQGTLAVIEEIDSSPQITALSSTRASPSVSSSHFREYLLESDGEIILVYLISRKSSVNIVDDVEVYKLNLARLSWVKLGYLGNRTLFVGTSCSMSVLASEVGCRRNCLYFRHPTADEWLVYDMKSGSISPGWSEGNSTTKSPLWIEPTED